MAQKQTDLFTKPQHLSDDQVLYKKLLKKHQVGVLGKYPLYPAGQIKTGVINQAVNGNLTAEKKRKLLQLSQKISNNGFYFVQKPFYLQKYVHVKNFLERVIDKKEQNA